MSKPGPKPRTALNGRQAPALDGRSGKPDPSDFVPNIELSPVALAEFNRLKDTLARRGWLEHTYPGILEIAAMLHEVSQKLYREIEERGPVVRLPNSYYAENPAFGPWMACIRLQSKLLADLTLTPASYKPAPASGEGGSGRWGRLLRIGDVDGDATEGA
jgi:hypothetical protein